MKYKRQRLSVSAPEIACEQNYYGEQLKSSYYHQAAEIELEYRVEHGKIPQRGCFSEGSSGI